ncbi:hypothetical protein LOC54_11140, partial [Acetobacter sp. AN02]|uniref:hypothetical protein n=1 Tax=Acetobacter sp. AN02 TaxID=2894186 RepID=UPI0024342DCB
KQETYTIRPGQLLMKIPGQFSTKINKPDPCWSLSGLCSSSIGPLPVWLGIGSKINDSQINLLQAIEKLGVPYGIRTRVAAVKGQGQIGNFRQMGAIMHNFRQHQNGMKQPRATV